MWNWVKDIFLQTADSYAKDGLLAGARYFVGGVVRLLQSFAAVRRNRDSAALAHRTSQSARTAMTVVLSHDFTREQASLLCQSGLQQELQPLLDSLTDYFHRYVTHSVTATCIKLLVTRETVNRLDLESFIYPPTENRIPHLDEPLVFTLVRDAESAKSRGRGIYYVNDCTAFAHFFNDRGDHLYSPHADLEKLYNNHEYKNPTPDFWKFYRSTMVIPIQWSPPLGQQGSPNLVGFLCLDCKEPKKFPRYVERSPHLIEMPEPFNTAAAAADALFWPLRTFLYRTANPEPMSPYVPALGSTSPSRHLMRPTAVPQLNK